MGFLDDLESAYKWVGSHLNDAGDEVADNASKFPARARNASAEGTKLLAGTLPGLVVDIARVLPGEQWKKGGWVDKNLGVKQTFGRMGNMLWSEGNLTGWAIKKSIEKFGDMYNAVDTAAQVPVYFIESTGDYAKSLELARDRSIGSTLVLQSANLFNDADPLEKDAWDDYLAKPGHSGARFLSGTVDVGAMFAFDPALIGLKVAGSVNKAKRATESFRQSALDDAFGFMTPTGKTTKGRRNLDGERVEVMPTQTYTPGRVDELANEDEAAALFELDKNHTMGDLVAKMIIRVRDIPDPATRINAGRALAGAIDGDAHAALELSKYSKELGYKFGNALDGTSGLNIFEAGAYDMAHAVEIGEGALRAAVHPESIWSVTDNLLAEPSFVALVNDMGKQAVRRESWVDKGVRGYFDLRGKPVGRETLFNVTPAGKRALARSRQQGLGRGGQMRSGHASMDFVANKVLRIPSTGIFAADSYTPAALVIRGDAGFKTITRADMGRMLGATAGWATGVRPAAKVLTNASKHLRNTRVFGAVSPHDAGLVYAVARHLVQTADMGVDESQELLSAVARAANESDRAAALVTVQERALAHMAKELGHDVETVTDLARGGVRYTHGMRLAEEGQRYAATQSKLHPERMVDGTPTNPDIRVIPDDDMAIVFVNGKPGPHPVLETQEVNAVEILDLQRAKVWLKRDNRMHAVGRWRLNHVDEEANPNRARQIRDGIAHHPIKFASNEWVSARMDETERLNSFWKRNILLWRAGSYAIRNTLEEQLRIWSNGYASVAAEHRRTTKKWIGKTGKTKAPKELSEELDTALHAAQMHAEDLRAILDDPNIAQQLAAHQRRAEIGGDLAYVDEDLGRYLEVQRVHDEAVEHLEYLQGLAANPRPFALNETITLADGTKYTYGQAYAGTSGKMSFDRSAAGNGQFDKDALDTTLSNIAGKQRRLLADNKPYLNIANEPGLNPEYVAHYWDEYAHIVNLQIRQSKPGMVAVRAKANGADEEGIVEAVRRWLTSDLAEAKNVRRANPVYREDIDTWAHDIANMVDDVVRDQDMARRLVTNDMDATALKGHFGDATELTPRLHRATGSMIMGMQGQITQAVTSRMFKRLDEMSLQRWTRHPMFAAYYEEAMARKVATWHDMVKIERGPDARVSSDELNALSEYARREAHHRIKQTFYDANVRSSAAHQLRFIYPFFAAHQDSVRFWGKTIKDDPAALRKLQIAFQSPANVGIVTDETGRPLEPGEPVNPLEHKIAAQLPSFLGGKFEFPLNSWMLMLQSGSILNPGAGPMVSLPLSYFSTLDAAMDEDWQKLIQFFQPYGAPKDPGILASAAPTPLKRLVETTGEAQYSRQYAELLVMRLTDQHVKFLEDHDGRHPTPDEWSKIEEKERVKIRMGMAFRLLASVVSPTQPRPQSEYSGLYSEFHRIRDHVRENPDLYPEPFAEVNIFTEKWGDIYYALTVSKSGQRSSVPGTIPAMGALKAHRRLRNKLSSSDSWGLIIGPEGEGEFHLNAYRAIQKMAENHRGAPIGEEDFFTRVRVGEGWQQYKRAEAIAIQDSKDRGYALPEEDPDFKAEKAMITEWVASGNETWANPDLRYMSNVSFGTLLSDARIVAADKDLLTDPARDDIRGLADYLKARDYADYLLSQREANGFDKTIGAEDNEDIQTQFTLYVASLADKHPSFRQYIMPRLVERDDYYNEDLLVEASE